MKSEAGKRPEAIVYTSQTGHTRRYAELLAGQTGLPACPLAQAERQLAPGTPVIYLGWVCASHVKGYARAARRFSVCAVGGVGLCPTGAMQTEVRRATAVPAQVPLFTLQGGIDRSRLRGMNGLAIRMLTSGLAGQKQRTPQEEQMLALLRQDTDCISPANLAGLLGWLQAQQEP